MPNTTEHSESEIDVLLRRMEANESRLVGKLAELRKDIESLRRAKSLLKQEDAKDAEVLSTISPKELHGKTQLEALEYIARNNGNRLRISLAKKLLSKAGLMKGNKKNYYNILYTIINRSERYKRVNPGEYELLPEDDSKRVLSMNKGFGAA